MPGINSGDKCRTNARNTRLARLRRTALPNRLLTMIPTRPGASPIFRASRLNRLVEIRRPWRLTRSISPLARRKMSFSPRGFDIVRTPTLLQFLPLCWGVGICVAGNRTRPVMQRERDWGVSEGHLQLRCSSLNGQPGSPFGATPG